MTGRPTGSLYELTLGEGVGHFALCRCFKNLRVLQHVLCELDPLVWAHHNMNAWKEADMESTKSLLVIYRDYVAHLRRHEAIIPDDAHRRHGWLSNFVAE